MPETEVTEKKTNKERIKEIVAGIEDGIQKLFRSDTYAEYLKTMSRFHSYSVNNTILIHLQMPNATVVAGFNQWKKRFGRHVKKGAKGITVIAPTPFKKKVEEMKLDPDTNEPMYDMDGKLIMEERTVEIPMFKPVKVFDLAQTEGKPLPQLSADLAGDVRQYEAFMEALRRSSPVPMELQPIEKSMDGYFSQDEQKIVIRAGMSQVQTVCAAVHEIGHAMLHNREQAALTAAAGTDQEPSKPKDRNTEEVEAESLSYSVCSYYGIETGSNSFGYIASWSKDKSLPELRASLETITKTANMLINSIDKHFAEICKERGIELSEPAEQSEEASGPEQSAPIKAEPEALFLLDGEQYLHIQTTDDGYDYTLYNADTLRLTDGGQFPEESTRCHATNDPMEAAYREVCVREGLDPTTRETIPLEYMETIAEANTIPEPAEEAPANELPDPTITPRMLDRYGYSEGDMLPLSKDRALELNDKGVTVFMLYHDGRAEMSFDAEDIQKHDGIFGVPTDEWEAVKGAIPSRDLEKRFLDNPKDALLIYQFNGAMPRDRHFEGYDKLGGPPLREHYDAIYTEMLNLPTGANISLDSYYEEFNLHRPEDFTGHSMSVGDILAIKRDGAVSYHYCDSIGFRDLPEFNKSQPENDLKNAELALEDDTNMIDGIINNAPKQPSVAELEAQVKAGQTISLMDLVSAVHAEKKPKNRPSVLARLNEPLPKQRKQQKTAPKRSAERNR